MSAAALDAHLATGATEVARCWKLTRSDGVVLGFTDHDRDLTFDGVTYCAGTGLSAAAVSQTTGLAVDNTEAVGALTATAVCEIDIAAGRFDGAEVEAWLVQWSAPENRALQFRGSIGEVTRAGGAFTAELRGLSEMLNVPRGRVYQKRCAAVLGDEVCRVDLSGPAFSVEAPILYLEGQRVLEVDTGSAFETRWFERGVLTVLDGEAEGLSGVIKRDRLEQTGLRRLELWDRLRAPLAAGDRVRLTAGCDKSMGTCRDKFLNILNYGGFPDIPGEDWLVTHPTRLSIRNGGSRR
jgi:uncharacterized phage protein (TIGR02218 family)